MQLRWTRGEGTGWDHQMKKAALNKISGSCQGDKQVLLFRRLLAIKALSVVIIPLIGYQSLASSRTLWSHSLTQGHADIASGLQHSFLRSLGKTLEFLSSLCSRWPQLICVGIPMTSIGCSHCVILASFLHQPCSLLLVYCKSQSEWNMIHFPHSLRATTHICCYARFRVGES